MTAFSLLLLLVLPILAASALVAATEHPQDDRGALAALLRAAGWLSVLRHRDGPGGLARWPGRMQAWWQPGKARWLDDANAEVAAVSIVCIPMFVMAVAALLSGCESFVAVARLANGYHAAAADLEARVDDDVEAHLVAACRKSAKVASDAARAAQEALVAGTPVASASSAAADRAAARMRKVCAFAGVVPGPIPRAAAADMGHGAPDAAPALPAPAASPAPAALDARPAARDGGA